MRRIVCWMRRATCVGGLGDGGGGSDMWVRKVLGRKGGVACWLLPCVLGLDGQACDWCQPLSPDGGDHILTVFPGILYHISFGSGGGMVCMLAAGVTADYLGRNQWRLVSRFHGRARP